MQNKFKVMKKLRKNSTPYIFIAPAMIIFSVLLFIPIGYSFYMSLFSWSLFGEHTFKGIDNYVSLILNGRFLSSLKNTVVYSLSVPIKVIFALLVSVLLNMKLKGTAFFRTSFFIPIVLSLVAVGMIWRWLFNIDSGYINFILTSVGLEPQKWLIEKGYAMLLIIIVSIWAGLGYNIIIYMAGLQGIPKNLYEAASIDGANSIKKFLYITVPSLKEITLFVMITSFIGSFKIFDLAYVLTQGGPAGSTNTAVQFIYEEAFQKYRLGYASAAAYIFFLIIFSLTIIQMKVFKEKDEITSRGGKK